MKRLSQQKRLVTRSGIGSPGSDTEGEGNLTGSTVWIIHIDLNLPGIEVKVQEFALSFR